MKKLLSMILILINACFVMAVNVEDVTWGGGTGLWLTQSNWTEVTTDNSKWAIPGWISGNPYNPGTWTNSSNKGFALIKSGMAQITSASRPDGRVERFYVGGTGGANLDISADLSAYKGWIGANAGETGTISQTAGAVSISGSTYFADYGTAIYNISGGSLTVSGELRVGTNGGSSGTVNVNGGTFSATNTNFSLGYQGNAELNQTNGTVSITCANAYIARFGDNAGVTNVNISGGTFGITSSSTGTGDSNGIFLGRTGTCNFNQTGGTVNLTAANSQIGIGYYKSGTTNFKNGAMSAKRYVIGYKNIDTVGTLNMSGGTLTASENMYLGEYWPANGTTENATKGVVNLSSGSINVTGTVYDGWSGNGAIDISGGSFKADRMFLSLNYDASTQPQASSLKISGGSFYLSGQLSTYSANDVITVSGSDATNIHVGHLVMRNNAILAFELDAGGITPVDVCDTSGVVNLDGVTLKVSTLSDFAGGIGTTYDVLKVKAGTIDMTDATLVQETGAKHTFSYAIVDDGNGGQILRFTEIQGTCGDALHPILDADVNKDCVVDYLDVREFAESWLDCTFDCP
jgi:hypothetical protein